MTINRLIFTAIFVCVLYLNASGAEIPEYIKPEHLVVVKTWLAEHKDYRVATDQDCRCDEDIRSLRCGFGGEGPNPNYHPYYVIGDFNLDGEEDFSLGVTGPNPGKFSVLIFHGPFTERHHGEVLAEKCWGQVLR